MPTVAKQILPGAWTRPLWCGVSPPHSGGWVAGGRFRPSEGVWRGLTTDSETLTPQKIKHAWKHLWVPRSDSRGLQTVVSPLWRSIQRVAGWSSGQGPEPWGQIGDPDPGDLGKAMGPL